MRCPQQEIKHIKNIKQWAKYLKLKSPKIMQSSAHKRFLQNYGGNSQKALIKNRKSFVRIRMAWEDALTTKSFNTAPAT